MDQPPDATETALLTYLATVDGATAATVAAERDLELPVALSRLGDLERRGFVEATPGGTYELTDEGRDALAGAEAADDDRPSWAARRPSWMQTVDVAIVDALDGGETPMEIGDLADAVEYPERRVRDRLEELAAQGLVQPVDERSVRLRDLGRAFVAGDLDASFLESA
ncbi:MAG: hypothetical protein ABEJ42_00535 [Halobacteriaceae archaeon]